jgi:Flp pilus assembly protein TadD
MIQRLDEARVAGSALIHKRDDKLDWDLADSLYGEAFRDYGLDVETLGVEEAGERIRWRSIRVELAAALDDWANNRKWKGEDNQGSWKHLLAVARSGDPDPWRNRFRDSLERSLPDKDPLQNLASAEEIASWPTPTLCLFGRYLARAGAVDEAVAVMRQAQRRHPDDFWINLRLAEFLIKVKPPQTVEGLGFFRVAVALHPEIPGVHLRLGIAFYEQGMFDEAEAAYREALRLKADLLEAHKSLGNALMGQGKLPEAEAEYRQAIRFQPDDPGAHMNLGNALTDQGKLHEAEAEYREAIRLNPDRADPHSGLGNILNEQGKLQEAEAECRKAICLNPNHGNAHCNLGVILSKQGKLAEAEAQCRAAVRLEPDSAELHSSLGGLFGNLAKFAEAETECRKAVRLKPDYQQAHSNLGMALLGQGRLTEAEAECRKAVRLKPHDAVAHCNLGRVLRAQGKLAEGFSEYREAIRLKPDLAEAHYNLGVALRGAGQLSEAEAQYREAIRLKPDFAAAHFNLALALRDAGQLSQAEGQYREAIRLRPDDPEAHYSLGCLLSDQGRLAEAEAKYRDTIRLSPDYAEAHCNLGHLLRDQGHFTAALAELRRGHELGSKRRNWPYPSAKWVGDCDRLVAADAKLPAVLSGKEQPKNIDEELQFALLCQQPCKRLFAASARFYLHAFATRPELADDVQAGHRYNGACTAALAGSGEGKDAKDRDEKERSRWRNQAREWLRADLAAWLTAIKDHPSQVRNLAQQTLRHWQNDRDLDGIRNPTALARLPAAEQEECRRMWTEVEAALKEVAAKK